MTSYFQTKAILEWGQIIILENKNNNIAKTLNEFIEWAARFKDGQYLFRGVTKDKYEIVASACRRLPDADKNNPSKLLKINQELIGRAQGLGHDLRDGRQLTDLELLAELQHFGAATCLIDFSRNALVALWFACQTSSGGEANGKVFAVNRDDTVRLKTVNPKLMKKDIDYFLQPDENGRYLQYQWSPKLQNNRIIAQQSVFVFSGVQIEAEAECVIDKDNKQEILISLEQISGITESSIYPDFDGFARLHAHNKKRIEPDAQTYLQRGTEAHQKGNWDVAIEYYTEFIRLEPTDTSTVSIAYYSRGVAYGEKGEVDRAIEDYTLALEFNSNFADAYHNRGYAHYGRGEFALATGDYNRAIQLKPENVLYYKNRSMALLHLQDWEKAKEDMTNARNMGENIIALFHGSYSSIADFEQKHNVKLPEDIVAMLTPP